MRVAILTELFYPDPGGQSVRYLELGRHLVECGHAVDVFAIRHRADLEPSELLDGIRVRRSPDSFDFIQYRWPGRRISGILAYAWYVRRLLKRAAGSYDMLLFNEWPIFHVLLAPRLAGLPLAVDWCEIRHTFLMKILQRMMVWRARINVCVSEAVRDTLVGEYGASPSSTVVIESGIRFHSYRSRRDGVSGGPRMLFMGRMVRHKRPDLAVGALRALLPIFPDATLRMVGDGPLRGPLQSEGSDLVEPGRLAFLGYVAEAEKIDILSGSDFLVLPSEREGFPRVVAEAMAAGVPVVTSDYPGNGTASVVRQYGIGAVVEHTAASLAAAVEQLWEQRDAYRRASQAARQYAASLDWHPLAERIVAIGRAMCAKQRS